VVCTAGISRSATVVIGYLVKQFKMQYEEAFKKVKKARIYVKPNKGFEEQLKTYAS